MKRIILFFVAAFFLLGCRKAAEKIIEEQALSFLEGTEWKVIAYTEGTTNLDAAFQPYKFRFNKGETVDAIRENNTIQAVGNWKANILALTIQASFGANAGYPLPLLTGNWTITENTLTSLTASSTENGVTRSLRMQKQP